MFSESTTVTFGTGAVHGRSKILAVIPYRNQFGVVVAETPFHPVLHRWPDQPGDTGVLKVAGASHPVVDCVVAAASVTGDHLLIGADITVKHSDPDWHWLVLHVVAGPVGDIAGLDCELAVDQERRAGLSYGHTACELATFAINVAMADRWRKKVAEDPAGRPDFDGAAITSSRIGQYESTDSYRLGKSLRKAGFVIDGLADDLPAISQTINDLLAGWIADDLPVRIDAEGSGLADRRWLQIGSGPGAFRLPCGGTHVDRTAQLGRVDVRLSLDASQESLVMRAHVHPDRADLR